MGIITPARNRELAAEVHRLYTIVFKKCSITRRNVRGHSEHNWNDYVNRLANHGRGRSRDVSPQGEVWKDPTTNTQKPPPVAMTAIPGATFTQQNGTSCPTLCPWYHEHTPRHRHHTAFIQHPFAPTASTLYTASTLHTSPFTLPHQPSDSSSVTPATERSTDSSETTWASVNWRCALNGRCAWQVCRGGVNVRCAWEVCMGGVNRASMNGRCGLSPSPSKKMKVFPHTHGRNAEHTPRLGVALLSLGGRPFHD
jgi:hypothetical protein